MEPENKENEVSKNEFSNSDKEGNNIVQKEVIKLPPLLLKEKVPENKENDLLNKKREREPEEKEKKEEK